MGSRERPFTTRLPSALRSSSEANLHTTSESAGSGDDRIAQRDTAQADRERGIPCAAYSASASARTRPVEEEGGATPQARAIVGARSTASTGDSNAPARKRGPYRQRGTLVS